MATKYEIKKFIERRKSEALSKLLSDRDSETAAVKLKFAAEYQNELASIKADLEAAADNFELLCETAAQEEIVYQTKYYGNPKYFINEAFSEMHDCNIAKYFSIPDVDRIKSKYENLSDETTREYSRLIAVTGNMSAKDGIELLKNLGFDTSRLETVKEVTALSISIDVNKLYLTREEE